MGKNLNLNCFIVLYRSNKNFFQTIFFSRQSQFISSLGKKRKKQISPNNKHLNPFPRDINLYIYYKGGDENTRAVNWEIGTSLGQRKKKQQPKEK